MNESIPSVNHKQIGYRIKEVREQNNFSQARLVILSILVDTLNSYKEDSYAAIGRAA